MSSNRNRAHDHDDAVALVRKLWQYCNVLRDDGLSYPDYVEQLTYLLFLKMSHEQAAGPVPAEYGWGSLVGLDATRMHRQYGRILNALGTQDGMLGLIFRNAKNKIRDPGKLRLLIVGLIGQTKWTGLSTDLKGEAYEGLLEKNARDMKSGAGQYFTPRPLIEAIVSCVNPAPGETICDPACGTGGFLLAAYQHVCSRKPPLKEAQRVHLATHAIRGVELVDEVARLAAMNLLLHGIIGTHSGEMPIRCADSLSETPKQRFDVVVTNPPFGVKGSITYTRDERSRLGNDLKVVRTDFLVQTANKQLNFLQHVVSLLKPGGRAAVVVPDNVLFESGAAASIRRTLLSTCNVHTLLRLPAGLFYAQGIKANVLFFDRPPIGSRDKLGTNAIRVYDLRSAGRFSLKTRPLRREDLDEFVSLYGAVEPGAGQAPNGKVSKSGRWQSFGVADILATPTASLDLSWQPEAIRGTGTRLERLEELSKLVAGDLQIALKQIAIVATSAQRRPK